MSAQKSYRTTVEVEGTNRCIESEKRRVHKYGIGDEENGCNHRKKLNQEMPLKQNKRNVRTKESRNTRGSL